MTYKWRHQNIKNKDIFTKILCPKIVLEMLVTHFQWLQYNVRKYSWGESNSCLSEKPIQCRQKSTKNTRHQSTMLVAGWVEVEEPVKPISSPSTQNYMDGFMYIPWWQLLCNWPSWSGIYPQPIKYSLAYNRHCAFVHEVLVFYHMRNWESWCESVTSYYYLYLTEWDLAW